MAVAAVMETMPGGISLGEMLGGPGSLENEGQFVASIADAAAALLIPQQRSSNAGRKLRFRKVEEVSSDTNIVTKWEEWRIALREAIEARSVSCGKVLEERTWQFDAGISMLCGIDTTVIAATSDGKSFAYQILPIASQGSSLLGVFPLISLQNDQVRSCQALGIKSCALNSRTMQNEPELLDQAARGEYEAVFVTPEFIRADNPNFMKLLGLSGRRFSPFRNKLMRVVIDESHLVFHWRKFRKQYVGLGIVRSFFPGIPILTLSATSPPHVRQRVHYTLGMARPTTLIEQSVDRPNIFLSVYTIRNTITSFLDLEYLVPKGAQNPLEIPKTVVFVDNRKTVWELTTYLLELIGGIWGDNPDFDDLVADYSTVLSQQHRDAVLEDFNEGHIRILVCTEAAGMGVDIPDISRVIQWGIPNFVNLSTLWQRMGRAGRKKDMQTVFSLWVQKSLKIKPGDSSNIRLYTSPITNDERSKTIMRHIIEYEEKMDLLAERFGMNVLHDFDEEGALSIEDPVGNNQIATSECINNDEDVVAHRAAQKKDMRLGFDRGVLTLASNSGCYRKLFLKYFDTEPKPLKSPNHCFENCVADPTQIPADIKQLLSPESYEAITEDEHNNTLRPQIDENEEAADVDEEEEENQGQDSEEEMDGSTSRTSTPTPAYLAVAALDRIYKFREEIWKKALGHMNASDLALLGPDSYLSDSEVRLIAKSVANISQPIHLCRYLKAKTHFQFAPVAPYVNELIQLCQRIVAETPKPPPAPRGPRAPRTKRQPNVRTTMPLPTMPPPAIPPPAIPPPTMPLPTMPLPTMPLPTMPPPIMPPPTPMASVPTPKRQYDPVKRRLYYERSKEKLRLLKETPRAPLANIQISPNIIQQAQTLKRPCDAEGQPTQAKHARTS